MHIIVRVGWKAKEENFRIGSVLLQEIDETGRIIKSIGELIDNGDKTHGDEEANDGVFSLKTNFMGNNEVTIRYLQFQVKSVSSKEILHVTPLKVHKRIPNALFDEQKHVLALGAEEYKKLKDTIGEELALKQIIRFLGTQTNVRSTGISTSNDIWIEFATRTLSGISTR